MWPKEYRDYPKDTPLVKERITTGKGLIGCEMHDLNGWGNSLHIPKKRKKIGFIRHLLNRIFGGY